MWSINRRKGFAGEKWEKGVGMKSLALGISDWMPFMCDPKPIFITGALTGISRYRY